MTGPVVFVLALAALFAHAWFQRRRARAEASMLAAEMARRWAVQEYERSLREFERHWLALAADLWRALEPPMRAMAASITDATASLVALGKEFSESVTTLEVHDGEAT